MSSLLSGPSLRLGFSALYEEIKITCISLLTAIKWSGNMVWRHLTVYKGSYECVVFKKQDWVYSSVVENQTLGSITCNTQNTMLNICTLWIWYVYILFVLILKVLLSYLHYTHQFCITCHNPFPHGKNSWLKNNLEVLWPVRLISNALNEKKYKSEIWTRRNVNGFAFMWPVSHFFTPFSREVHHLYLASHVNDFLTEWIFHLCVNHLSRHNKNSK